MVFRTKVRIVENQIEELLDFELPPTSTLEFGLGLASNISCRQTQMLADIAADPPSADFERVVPVDVADLPSSQLPEWDDVAAASARFEGYGRAQLAASERYQGALEAGALAYQHAQAAAITRSGDEMVDAARDLATSLTALRTKLQQAGTLTGPLLTDTQRSTLTSWLTRIRAGGFNADELARLRAAGLTDSEITELRTEVDIPFEDDLAGSTLDAVLAASAASLTEELPALAQFNNIAAAVAAATNQVPAASFTLTPTNGPAPLTVTAADTSTSSDLDALTVTWDFGDGASATGPNATHTYNSGGTYTVTHTVTDGYSSVSSTRTVTVGSTPNQPPNATATATPTGGGAPLVVEFDGAGSADPDGSIVSYAWDFGDGAVGSGVSTTHTYANLGTYTATLTVTDDDGASAIAAVNVTVSGVVENLPPVAVVSTSAQGGRPPLTVDVDASGSYDPEGTALTYAWDFGDGTTAAGSTAQHVYTESGTFTLRLRVTDQGGAVAVATKPIVVTSSNLAPVANAGADQTGNEGATLFFNGNGSFDVDGAIASYRWDWGDGAIDEFTGYGNAWHAYSDNGIYTVRLTVTDSDGATAVDTATVVIANLAPFVSLSPPFSRLSPGVELDFGSYLAVTEPGTADVVSVTWNWGDGSQTNGLRATHAYTAPGAYVIRVRAADDDGAVAETTFEVLVAPLVADAGPDVSIDEGDEVVLGGPGTSPMDPLTTYEWDFGDGSPLAGNSGRHVYRDDGTYVARLTVRDGSGSATDEVTVRVANAAPVIRSTGSSDPARTGQPVSFRVFAEDVGPDDSLTYLWDFGDGTTGLGSAPTHTFATAGDRTVTVTVLDDDGARTSAQRLVSVRDTAPGDGRADHRGTDFWLAFNSNYSGPADLKLFITAPSAATGRVEVPGVGFSQPFTVAPDSVTTVQLPDSVMMPRQVESQVEPKGIHVVADADVVVYGLNRIRFSTDAFLGLPTDVLGTEHFTLAYAGAGGEEFGVVATANGTKVTISPPGRVTYEVDLNLGDVHQLWSPGDSLTGTRITSNRPVSVFGANNCAGVPSGVFYCDHIAEQLPPVSAWGQTFVTKPLATRRFGDTFRVIASQDGTRIRVNGDEVATIDAGQVIEQLIEPAALIQADHPVLVAQYSNGGTFDSTVSDPFMMLITPIEQFYDRYTVTTPASGFAANFINLVVPTAAVGSVLLDGASVDPALFTTIDGTAFSGAQVPVELGSHTLKASLPFGAYVYGFDRDDSYGYPAGSSLARISSINSVVLEPARQEARVGDEACVSAVVTDDAGRAVANARVDFSAVGVNPSSVFVFTDQNGRSQFCYRGSQGGLDTITATVGSSTRNAAITWSSVVNQPPVASGVSVSTLEDTPVGVVLSGSDPDGDVVSFTVVSQPAHGSLSGVAPNLTYTPAGGFSGPDSFTYVVSDGVLTSAPAAVSITVSPVNDPPVAGDVGVSTLRDTPVGVSLFGNDPEGDALSFSVVSRPSNGSLSGSGSSLTYTPAAGFVGSDSFTYVASDGSLTSAPATVSISVNRPANRPPAAMGDRYEVAAGAALRVVAPGVLGNDSDPDGDLLRVDLNTPPAHGILDLDPSGSFVYTPNAGFVGSDSLSYRAVDPSGAFAVATVEIVVTGIDPKDETRVTGGGFYGLPFFGTKFGFVVRRAGSTVSGQFQLANCSGVFHSEVIERLEVKGDTVTFGGVGRWNGRSDFRFEVTAKVLRGRPDRISVLVRRPSGQSVYASDGLRAIWGGQIRIQS